MISNGIAVTIASSRFLRSSPGVRSLVAREQTKFASYSHPDRNRSANEERNSSLDRTPNATVMRNGAEFALRSRSVPIATVMRKRAGLYYGLVRGALASQKRQPMATAGEELVVVGVRGGGA